MVAVRARAHALRIALGTKLRQASGEVTVNYSIRLLALASRPAAHRIVGVVVKTLILPEGIDVRRNILCTCAEAAEFGDMLICDLKSRQ